MLYCSCMEACVVLHKPWENWAGTCLRCRGPFSQFCADGKLRCHRAPGFPYDCAICGLEVTTVGPVPKSWDSEAWAKIQAQHAPACTWAKSRDYRVMGPQALHL
jgi:hypothetical protein